MTSEHEDDTWTSLTATDLTGREIVLAKLFGSLWRVRGKASGHRTLQLVAGIGVGRSIICGSLVSLAMVVYGYRRGAGDLDLDPAPVDLAGPVPDDLVAPGGERFRAGRPQHAVATGFAPLVWPGLTPYAIARACHGVGLRPHAAWRAGPVLADLGSGRRAGLAGDLSIMGLMVYAALLVVLMGTALGGSRSSPAGPRAGGRGPALTAVGEEREAASEAVPVAVGSDAG